MAVCANENQQNLLQDVQKVVGIPSDYSNLKTSNGLQSIIEMPEVLGKLKFYSRITFTWLLFIESQ